MSEAPERKWGTHKSPLEVITRLKELSHPSAEAMPDGYRLTEFILAAQDAIALLETENAD